MSRLEPEYEEYISAAIHKNFYFNKELGAPTLIKEYPRIEKMLTSARYVACLTIQIHQLNRIEYQYGSVVYNNLLSRVTAMLKELKEREFRREDVFLVDLFDVDTFIVFLSAPRSQDTQLLDHLESIAERTRVAIDQEVFRIFYPYTKEYSKPAVGFGLVIKNPMINNMRHIMQLVAGAKRMGEFMAEKHRNAAKFQLQKIIIEKRIYTVYQPIIDLATLEVMGYEALSRGPQGTEFSQPLLLFALAADLGLSFELDTLCRHTAFRSAGEFAADKKIFVNTLTMTIHDPEFRGKYLEELMTDLKIKPGNVIFEINEKLAIDNYDAFRNALRDYSDIGIVHASDDIGNGYADLERIMELNPGYMKIDIGLVRDIHKSYIKQQIIKAMVDLARSLGAKVIAEGIETMEELAVLTKAGVHYGQGYLFGKPSEQPGEIDKEKFLRREL